MKWKKQKESKSNSLPHDNITLPQLRCGLQLRNICLTNPTCGCATPSAHPVVALGSWPRSGIFPLGAAKVSRISWLHCKSRDLFSHLLVCRLLWGKLNDATIPSLNLVIHRIRFLSRNTVPPCWINIIQFNNDLHKVPFYVMDLK